MLFQGKSFGKLNGTFNFILYDGSSNLLYSVNYTQLPPWPANSSLGYSIVPKDMSPFGNPSDGTLWVGSANLGGSPGSDDPNTSPTGSAVVSTCPYPSQNYQPITPTTPTGTIPTAPTSVTTPTTPTTGIPAETNSGTPASNGGLWWIALIVIGVVLIVVGVVVWYYTTKYRSEVM